MGCISNGPGVFLMAPEKKGGFYTGGFERGIFIYNQAQLHVTFGISFKVHPLQVQIALFPFLMPIQPFQSQAIVIFFMQTCMYVSALGLIFLLQCSIHH